VSVPLARFAELVSREQFGLAEACLLVAQDAYPDLDVGAHLRELDAIAAGVERHLGGERSVEEKIAALNRHLYAELGFSGNVDEYYDPRNSYLNDVLARRTGIPITLSVVYLEVARRIGLSMQGVSFPGHFLVKLRARRGQLVLDPFARGEPQSEDDLRERLEQVLPRPLDPDAPIDPYLEPASPRQIVVRVLRNLKAIHVAADEPQCALDVLNRLLLVSPEATTELRDRGLVYARLECFRPALADLQSYLRRVPDAPDAAAMHEKIVALKGLVSRLQ
jgi:regulator of sirC expression with transglutaminase-like and TPR domain